MVAARDGYQQAIATKGSLSVEEVYRWSMRMAKSRLEHDRAAGSLTHGKIAKVYRKHQYRMRLLYKQVKKMHKKGMIPANAVREVEYYLREVSFWIAARILQSHQ